MKNVLVTGGTGCVGSNLAAALIERGYCVSILRREHSDLRAIAGIGVEHRFGDLRDLSSLQAAMRGCDTVFHTAAIVSHQKKKWELQLEVNVIGTRNIVEACVRTGIERLIHTSSVAAIGYPAGGRLATEETDFNWPQRTGYRYSKHLAEKEVMAGVQRGLHAVMVNPSVIVGERDVHFHGGQLIRDIKKGRVPLYISGGMNVVYVGDVVRGHIQAALAGKNGERYILSGENLTHKEIFRRTAGIVGGRGPIAELPLPLLRTTARIIEGVSDILGIEPLITTDLVTNAGKLNWYSCEKAQRELDYRITPFDETIRAAYRWYRENGFL